MYEYFVLTLMPKADTELQSTLAKLTTKDLKWELVCVNNHQYIFKRPKV